MAKAREKRKTPKRDKLTQAQEFFCFKYVELGGMKGKGAEAARRAGSKAKNPDVVAAKWLALAKVQKRIQELMAKVENKAIKTAEDWDREIDMIAFYRGHHDFYKPDGTLKDISELTDEQLAIIHEIEHTQVGGGNGSKPLIKVTNLKVYDKLKALDMKGKRLGIYRSTVVVEDPFSAYIDRLEQKRKESQGKKS
ncbi:MAG: hypothetical protein C4586_08405 [Anaerolineaceae bacterium]|nr:MAG: hypothetical protein C4586_08405 [Anaerolineaceae bacterium]